MSSQYDFPITADQLLAYCHPADDHIYEKPFVWGDHVGVCNGYLAMVVESFVDCDREMPEAVERFNKRPWAAWKDYLNDKPSERWGKLHERRGNKMVTGKDEFWTPVSLSDWKPELGNKNGWRVMVGHPRNVIPCPILQLIARLPRAEVYLENFKDELLPFRFNGGYGFAKCLDVRPPKWKLWEKKEHPMDKF